ncbi:protein of unknown function [Bacillus sp. ok061]|nr:protein of unknown function [Bacillus sp. ok061]
MLTEREELVAVAIFLTIGYVGVFLIHKFMDKKTTGFVILFIIQIVGCSFIPPFSLFGTIMLPLFFFIVHATGPGYPVQKSLSGIAWFVAIAIFDSPFSTLWKLLLLILHIMITFWLTGSNRNQQLLRFTSVIGTISGLLIPIFPYRRLIFSSIVQVVALGFGYPINPLFSATELKEPDDFGSNKGNLKNSN